MITKALYNLIHLVELTLTLTLLVVTESCSLMDVISVCLDKLTEQISTNSVNELSNTACLEW